MTTATEIIGPVVRMCGNPLCGSEDSETGCSQACPPWLMGMSMAINPDLDDGALCPFFSRELSLTYATDGGGMRRVIPDGCEFTLHKMPPQAEFEGRELGRVAWSAWYSGPARDLDEALAGSPEWDWDAVHERYKRMRAGGVASA